MLDFAVETSGPDVAARSSVREALHDAAPTIPIAALLTVEDLLERQLAPVRANAAVLGALALFTLVIAALGIYTLIRYLVVQRTAEIGIRLALGATHFNVRGLLLASAIRTVGLGIAAGLCATVLLLEGARRVRSDIGPVQPWVLTIVAVVLTAVALTAAYLGARATAAVDPMQAIKGS
jgi:ABC-type antimicrobial peptide transport system permease subunit